MGRLDRLKRLREILNERIEDGPGARDLAQLARQYRETLKEIDEIEGVGVSADEISEIIKRRQADGKAGAVRKGRAKIPPN